MMCFSPVQNRYAMAKILTTVSAQGTMAIPPVVPALRPGVVRPVSEPGRLLRVSGLRPKNVGALEPRGGRFGVRPTAASEESLPPDGQGSILGAQGRRVSRPVGDPDVELAGALVAVDGERDLDFVAFGAVVTDGHL